MHDIEKRKYERVSLPQKSGAYVEDANGKHLGALRVIGQGGLFCECDPKTYRAGEMVLLRIVDPSEGIERKPTMSASDDDVEGQMFVRTRNT